MPLEPELTGPELKKVGLRLSQRDVICPAFVIRVLELDWIILPEADRADVVGARGLFVESLIATAGTGEESLRVHWPSA